MLRWSTTPVVTAAEPGREFGFKTNDTNWRYTFEVDGTGTKVTESFEVPHYNALYNLVQPARKREPTGELCQIRADRAQGAGGSIFRKCSR